MSGEQKPLNPAPLSADDLKVIGFVVAENIKDLLDKPMTAKEVIKWTGWSEWKFYNMVNRGVIKGHCKEHGDPIYLRSEIIEQIKRQ